MFYFFSSMQERSDGLSGSSPRISQLCSLNQNTYSAAPPLCHTPASDFQPPYFPPPYPQASFSYSQSQDSGYPHLADPYQSISSLHQHQQAWHPPRSRNQEDAGLLSHSQRSLSFEPRRDYHGVPRLLHALGEGAGSGVLADASALNVHNQSQHTAEELQVKTFNPLHTSNTVCND